jgi:predicted nucleotidyltransferase
LILCPSAGCYKKHGLKFDELNLVRSVFLRHPEIETVTVFGSCAIGTHSDRSDVDLAVTGAIEPLQAEAIASELDELPLPYRFEVQSLAHVHHQPLLDHIRRVGIQIYPAT